MRRALAGVALLAACHLTTPLGWTPTAHAHWTVPLVGPLEEGLLLVPVYVHGHGPFLFRISPDSPETYVTRRVVSDAELRSGETYVTPVDLTVGDLALRITAPRVVDDATFDVNGRRIDGSLGADVLVDGVAFGFDRDAGLAYLYKRGGFVPPAGATRIWYDERASEEEGWTPRKLVRVQIGGQRFRLHVDLGTEIGTLREPAWRAARERPLAAHLRVVDPVGEAWTASEVKLVRDLTLGGLTPSPVAFAEDAEPPPETAVTDGTIALDAFRRYRVWIDPFRANLVLAPRADVPVAQRIARWGWSCAAPGCVEVQLAAGDDDAPVLTVTRDPAMTAGLEVLLAPPPAEARSIDPVIVNLPVGTTTVSVPLAARYQGAHLAVVDASPFPRHCPKDGGCADVLGGTRGDVIAPP